MTSILRSRHADSENSNASNYSENNTSSPNHFSKISHSPSSETTSPRPALPTNSPPNITPTAATSAALPNIFKPHVSNAVTTPTSSSSARSSSSHSSGPNSSRSSSASANASLSHTADNVGQNIDLIFLFFMITLVLGTTYFMFFHSSSPFLLHSSPLSPSASHHHHHSRPAVEDTTFTLRTTLEAVYMGTTVKAPFPGGKQLVCPVCNGLGGSADDVSTCEECHGRGTQIFRQQFLGMIQQMQRTCPACNGEGKIIRKACEKCGGRGVVRQHGDLEVPLPRGVPDGHVITIEGAGHELAGFESGDVHIQLQTVTHGRFTREADNLHVTLSISLRESLLGFVRTVKHLDGHFVPIQRTAVITPPDLVLEIDGEGMPIFGSERKSNGWVMRMLAAAMGDNSPAVSDDARRMEFGKLFVHFIVEFPDELTDIHKHEIRKLLSSN